MPDSLGDRMKTYENAYRLYLPKRLPVIIRVDGRAFHTFTRGFQRPFDPVLAGAMWCTATDLCKEISGAKLAYTQSDEISVLVTNNDTISTQPWFDNNLQKLVSLSAAIASTRFQQAFRRQVGDWLTHDAMQHPKKQEDAYCEACAHPALFDARVFVIPPDEVCNYFIWRQQDAIRNSIQMVAQTQFTHKELQNKNQAMLQDMLMEKGINWNEYELWQKRGMCVRKVWKDTLGRACLEQNMGIPIFTQARDYIEDLLPRE